MHNQIMQNSCKRHMIRRWHSVTTHLNDQHQDSVSLKLVKQISRELLPKAQAFCYTSSCVLESWQSGNATDSKSVEPANTGAQVQILYSPEIERAWYRDLTPVITLFFAISLVPKSTMRTRTSRGRFPSGPFHFCSLISKFCSRRLITFV